MLKKKPKKVVIGLSGGIDSSVSAFLLKNQGYQVIGLFLRLWKDGEDSQLDKEEEKTIADLRKMCATLDIPLKIVDMREKFRKTVVKYFLQEYKKGRTPNPCIFCNKNLKFKILWEEMKKTGADYMATGHYARLGGELKVKKEKLKTKKEIVYKLYQAKDQGKDQSYFLHQLDQKKLARTIFPLGEYKKEEVRKLARKYKLAAAWKQESQDVCFLSSGGTEKFLKDNLRLKPGKIVDSRRQVLGEHLGLALYTLGQRKGINIGGTGPYYVVAKDYKTNSLVVSSSKEKEKFFCQSAELEDIFWINPEFQPAGKLLLRTRYRNPLVYATIKKRQVGYELVFEEPQWALTPGQSAVFYNEKGEVLGGGIIK